MPLRQLSPLGLGRSLLVHRDLCLRMASREVAQRFQGSMLGMVWAVLTPLLTAAVYTLVFTGIFPTRWPRGNGTSFDFALILLVGLAVYNLFAEIVSRAPQLVVSNPSYVTKVVFPLEILPAVALLSGLVNLGVTFAIVLVGQVLAHGTLHWTAVFLPVVLLPFLIFLLGSALLIAALGVFIRDLSLVVTPVISMLMFLSPIFFPLEAVPASWRFLVRLNPITSVVEQARTVVLFGGLPDFGGLGLYAFCALVILSFAYWVFQRLRPGFADVL